MNPLDIKGTNDTPRILFDPDNDIFEITGRSLPEDVVTFYQPVLEWLDEYSHHPNERTEFIFKLIYFNTATSKLIQDILSKLENIYQKGYDVKVIWFYEKDDEDMKELGEEFKEYVEIPFEIVSY